MQSFYGGPRGPKGDRGPQGLQGPPGSSFTIKGFGNIADDRDSTKTPVSYELIAEGDEDEYLLSDGNWFLILFSPQNTIPYFYLYSYNNNSSNWTSIPFGTYSNIHWYQDINNTISKKGTLQILCNGSNSPNDNGSLIFDPDNNTISCPTGEFHFSNYSIGEIKQSLLHPLPENEWRDGVTNISLKNLSNYAANIILGEETDEKPSNPIRDDTLFSSISDIQWVDSNDSKWRNIKERISKWKSDIPWIEVSKPSSSSGRPSELRTWSLSNDKILIDNGSNITNNNDYREYTVGLYFFYKKWKGLYSKSIALKYVLNNDNRYILSDEILLDTPVYIDKILFIGCSALDFVVTIYDGFKTAAYSGIDNPIYYTPLTFSISDKGISKLYDFIPFTTFYIAQSSNNKTIYIRDIDSRWAEDINIYTVEDNTVDIVSSELIDSKIFLRLSNGDVKIIVFNNCYNFKLENSLRLHPNVTKLLVEDYVNNHVTIYNLNFSNKYNIKQFLESNYKTSSGNIIMYADRSEEDTYKCSFIYTFKYLQDYKFDLYVSFFVNIEAQDNILIYNLVGKLPDTTTSNYTTTALIRNNKYYYYDPNDADILVITGIDPSNFPYGYTYIGLPEQEVNL